MREHNEHGRFGVPFFFVIGRTLHVCCFGCAGRRIHDRSPPAAEVRVRSFLSSLAAHPAFDMSPECPRAHGGFASKNQQQIHTLTLISGSLNSLSSLPPARHSFLFTSRLPHFDTPLDSTLLQPVYVCSTRSVICLSYAHHTYTTPFTETQQMGSLSVF